MRSSLRLSIILAGAMLCRIPFSLAEDAPAADKAATEAPAEAAAPAAEEPAKAALGEEMVEDSDFSAGNLRWSMWNSDSTSAAMEKLKEGPDGKSCAKVIVSKAGKEWEVVLTWLNMKVTGAADYTLSFKAKAEKATSLDVALGQNHDPWQKLSKANKPALSTEWQEFSYTCKPASDDENARLTFEMGGTECSFWITDVSLRKNE